MLSYIQSAHHPSFIETAFSKLNLYSPSSVLFLEVLKLTMKDTKTYIFTFIV